MKKVTCVLLGFCLALSVFLSGGIELDMTTVHASDSVLGDITGDDAVTSDDTAALEQYLVGNATANEDVNGDGTSADVRDLVRYERYVYLEGEKAAAATATLSTNEDGAYVISNVRDLYCLAQNSSTYWGSASTSFVVTDDIQVNVGTGDLTDWDGTEQLLCSWAPIGNSSSVFKGQFNGNGSTISGLYLSTETLYSGLFGRVSTDSVIQNFRLMDSCFKSTATYAASVVGFLEIAEMKNVYSNAAVISSGSDCGGLVGRLSGSKAAGVSNCWFDGSVQCSAAYAGGLIGRLVGTNSSEKNISNCLNTGNITSTNTGDGLCGGLYGAVASGNNAKFNMTVENCLNIGVVTASKTTAVGTVTGNARSTKTNFTNVYTTDNFINATGAENTFVLVGVGTKANTVTGEPVLVYDEAGVENSIIGSAAATTLSGFDFTGTDTTDPVWYAVEGSTPVLYIFRDLAK